MGRLAVVLGGPLGLMDCLSGRETLRSGRFATTPVPRRVIDAILAFRTGVNGSVVYYCESCGCKKILNIIFRE